MLKHEQELLFSSFSYLQQKAIATNKKLELTFVPTANSYSYPLGGTRVTHTLNDETKFGYMPFLKGPPSTKRTVITKAITFRDNKVFFLPNGQISPGAVYMTDIDQKHLNALTCSVSQVSFIRKYTFISNKWTLC